jgi:hypothetical protein
MPKAASVAFKFSVASRTRCPAVCRAWCIRSPLVVLGATIRPKPSRWSIVTQGDRRGCRRAPGVLTIVPFGFGWRGGRWWLQLPTSPAHGGHSTALGRACLAA